MAVRSYIDKDGNLRWEASIKMKSKSHSDINCQRKRTGFETEEEARKAEKKIRDIAVLDLKEKETAGKSWKALVDTWEMALLTGDCVSKKVTAGTVQDYVGPIRKYTAEWMGLPAAQIRRNEVRKALVHVGQTVSPIRADKLKGFISIAFKWALDTDFDSNLHQNPVHGITVEGLNRRPKRPDILTGEEIRHLLSSAKTIQSPWYPVWAMAVMTGMRSGELYALLWKDVDFTSDQISVTKSYSKKAMVKERDKYPDGIKSTKTEEWRHIPISTDLKDFLVELRRKTGHTSHVLPRIAAWGYGSQAAVLKEFCRCIEIKPVVFHALRACFAVQMLQSGVPAVTAMAIGGWEDMKTMMRYVRMAGVETKGATQNLKLLPPKDAMATVLKFTGQSGG